MNEIEQQLNGATSGFNGFDWFIVLVLLISLLVGLYRGFGREILSLAGWLCAFIGANLMAQSLANSLTVITDSETLRYLMGWALIFVGVLAIFSVLGRLMARQMRQPGFNLGNRVLGGVFGLLRGVVFVIVATFVLRSVVPNSEQDLVNRSALMPTIDEISTELGGHTAELLKAEPVEQIEETLESAEMI
ncbi:MAG: CvpA family protein [Luminiphilus sp.]|nr:CvpA family protein [Luminiphilus sp.]